MPRNWDAYKVVLTDEKMWRSTKLVYFSLWMHQNKWYYAWPKKPTLAIELHITEQSVRVAFRTLEGVGVIHKAGQTSGGVTVWFLGQGECPRSPKGNAHVQSGERPDAPHAPGLIIYEHVQGTNPHEPAQAKDDEMPKDEHAEAFKTAFDHQFTTPYKWKPADFVKLAAWRKDYADAPISPQEFTALAEWHWNRGQYCPKVSLSIKGVCCAWAELAATRENASKRPHGSMPNGRIILKGAEKKKQLDDHKAGQDRRLAKSQAERAARQQKKG